MEKKDMFFPVETPVLFRDVRRVACPEVAPHPTGSSRSVDPWNHHGHPVHRTISACNAFGVDVNFCILLSFLLQKFFFGQS